jgi:hypothetical protein
MFGIQNLHIFNYSILLQSFFPSPRQVLILTKMVPAGISVRHNDLAMSVALLSGGLPLAAKQLLVCQIHHMLEMRHFAWESKEAWV